MTMKLMSWNIDGRIDKKTLSNHLSKIENENVDILALQEVKQKTVHHFKKELAEIGLVHVETSHQFEGPPQYGVILASRYRLEIQRGAFSIPWQKSALSAVVKSQYGEIELHAIHAPNGSNHRRQKIDTFNGIYKALSGNSKRHRILCGDFNSPQEEYRNGHVLTFDKKNEEFDGIEGRDCERRVICGLAKYDLADTYRELNGYEKIQYSHFNKNKKTRRRTDHIFSSHSLNPLDCDYLHPFHESDPAPSWRSDAVYDSGCFLSDHAPVYATYEPEQS